MIGRTLFPLLLVVLLGSVADPRAGADTLAAFTQVGVSVAGVDFGAIYDTAATYFGHGTIVITAPAGAAFSIALSGGFHPDGDHRNLQRIGGRERIPYNLYSDAGCTIPWGDSDSSATFPSARSVMGLGMGRDQPITTYGKLTLPALLPAGAYADSVTVSILY